MSDRRRVLGLVGWLVLSYVAAGVGAVASIQAKTFYASLVRPAWAPPASFFGPVWTVLYAMMGVAAWMVWRRGGFTANRPALLLFMAQLALNALWSWLFFVWHQGAAAMLDIIVLELLILATLISFWRAHTAAGALLVPYLGWVGFAAGLNYAVWQLNPTMLG